MASGNTRSDLLSHIVTRGGATVADLSRTLALADATIRRHLDKLEVEGLVTTRLVRQSTGRPYQVFEATDAGVRRERDHSADLAVRLIGQLENGPTELDRVAEGLAERIVADHRHQVRVEDPLEERVARTVDVLHAEGILDGWERTESGFRLHNHACPYRSAADASDCLCESDRLAIEKLIGAGVEQVGSVAHGNAACEYVVDAANIVEPRPAPRRGPSGTR